MTINSTPGIHHQVICSNCFIRKNNKYLVLRRSEHKKYAPGVVHPVGGKVEINENALTAAIREVREETGLEIDKLKLEAVLLEIEPVLDEPYNWLIFYFSGNFKAGELKNTEEGELIWLSADELRREKLFPSVELVIDQILNNKTGTVFAKFEYDAQKQNIIKKTINVCDIS